MFLINASSTDIIIDYIGTLFSDLVPIVVLVIGVPLGFYVIKKLLDLAGTRTR